MRRMFSEKQILALVNAGIDPDVIVSKLEGKDIVGKTFRQTQANFELDLGNAIETRSDSDLDYTNVYSKIIRENNLITIMINLVITAKTNVSGKVISPLIVNDVPEEIGAHLIDFAGKNLTQATGGAGTISLNMGGMSSTGSSSWSGITNAFINHYAANSLSCYLGISSLTMSEGDKRYISLRSFLSLY